MLLVAANKKFWELLLEMGMTNLELEVGNEERQGIAEEWMWCREWFGSSEAGESMVLGKKSVSSEPTHFDSRAGRIESSPIERTCPGGGERDARFGRQECRRKLGERSELWRGPTDKKRASRTVSYLKCLVVQ